MIHPVSVSGLLGDTGPGADSLLLGQVPACLSK